MQVHTCLPHMQDPIYVFCETKVNKKEYEQLVICLTCLYANVQIEIKNQVRNQVENQVKVQEHEKRLITFTMPQMEFKQKQCDQLYQKAALHLKG